MKKGNAGVTLLIVLLFIVVIALSLFIVGDKLNDNTNNNEVIQNNHNNTIGNNENIQNNTEVKNDKVDLTAKEIEEIEEFINKGENNPFAIKTYSNPADLFNNKNSYPTSFYLKYAVQLSEYAKRLTEEELTEIRRTIRTCCKV